MKDTKNIVTKVILIACACFILVVLIFQFHKKQKRLNTSSEEESSYVKEHYDNYNNTGMRESVENDSNVVEDSRNNYFKEDTQLLQNNQNAINGNNNIQSIQNIKDRNDRNDTDVMPSEPISNEDMKAVDFDTKITQPVQCFPKDKLVAEDLLPKDAANSRWAEVNPAGQGDVADKNFLSAGFHIGVDTVGQSLRNPNYQLRSDPPNPRLSVGPWNQSTIEFDQSRKHFEINQC